MSLQETIFIRKTTRQFDVAPLTTEELRVVEEYLQALIPLRGEISIEALIVSRDAIKTMLPWGAPHYVLIHAEETDEGLLEVGFRFQQLDLYLQTLGFGSCWLGMAKPRNERPGLPFVIMIAFGRAKHSPHRNLTGFKRKGMEQITDLDDERLEGARLAPSATNRQPWYFLHDETECIHVFSKEFSFLGRKDSSRYSHIDVGIALYHLYLTNPKSFQFEVQSSHPELPGHKYQGTIQL